MHALLLLGIGAVAGLVAGTIWGRKLEQKAVGLALNEYHQLGRISVSVLGELKTKLPWLARHL